MFRHLFICVLTLICLPASLGQVVSPARNPINEALAALDKRGLNLALQIYSDTLAGPPAIASAPHAAGFQFLDLSADLNVGQLTPYLRHTRLYTSFHVNEGGGADFDAAYQSMIGITSPPGVRLAEVWIEHEFNPSARIRVGKIDANPEFAIVNSGSKFLNASFSYDPTFFTLPNYGSTSWGTELLMRNRHVHLNLAAFDPLQGTGALLVEEAGVDWNPDGFTGRFAVGGWQQTGNLATFSGSPKRGARGYYVVGEQKFWKRVRKGSRSEQSLTAFAQLGSAPSYFSTFTGHIGAGIVWTAPFAHRSQDSAGFGVTRGRFTQQPAAAFDYKYETIVETYYSFQLNSFLSVTPDVQYVSHPGGTATNSLASGARIVVTLKPKAE